jgi:hypothetical protein
MNRHVFAGRVTGWLLGVLLTGTIAVLTTAARAAQPTDPQERTLFAILDKAINTDAGLTPANALLDLDALGERVVTRASLTGDERTKTKQGLVAGFGNGSLLSAIRQNASQKGHLVYLRTETVGGERRLTCRVQGAMGLNYIGFIVEPRAGSLKIVDFYSLMTGELVSQTIANEIVRTLLRKNAGNADAAEVFAKAITDMRQAIQANTPQKALDVFNALEPRLKSSRALLLARLQAGQMVSDAEYIKAIDDMVRLLPDDATAALISVDGLLLAKRYDDASKAVSRVDAAVKDPYLDSLRASVAFLKGDAPAAVKLARSALKADPMSYQAVDILLTSALKANDFPAIADALERLEFDQKQEIVDLNTAEGFKPFVDSPEYPRWMARRKARAATRPS